VKYQTPEVTTMGRAIQAVQILDKESLGWQDNNPNTPATYFTTNAYQADE
jgi:hypothetical protein